MFIKIVGLLTLNLSLKLMHRKTLKRNRGQKLMGGLCHSTTLGRKDNKGKKELERIVLGVVSSWG